MSECVKCSPPRERPQLHKATPTIVTRTLRTHDVKACEVLQPGGTHAFCRLLARRKDERGPPTSQTVKLRANCAPLE
eukprot:7376829-Prymnesium_polylepis.1